MAKTKEAAAEKESAGRERHWLDNTFIKRVTEAYDGESSVAEIAKSEGVAKGQVALALLRGRVPVKSRQLLEDDEDTLAKETVRLRNDESLSWGIISATLGVPESRVRTVYSEATGSPHKGNRIGKGGRHPGDVNGAKSPAAKKAAGSTKKAPAAGGKVVPIREMDLEQLQGRLDGGTTITVGRGTKSTKHKVKNVTGLTNGEMTFADAKGAARTVKVNDITKASPKGK